jgi:hypothetical protein
MSRPFKGQFRRKVKVTATCPEGVGHERLAFPLSNPEEVLFRLAWQDLHHGPMYGGSTACDLLSHLLAPTDRAYPFNISTIDKRDRVVAATVIQWLGTNVGSCFLRDVMEESARLRPIIKAYQEATGYWHPRSDRPRLSPETAQAIEARQAEADMRKLLGFGDRRIHLRGRT